MLMLVPGAWAQGQLTLSKNADFTTSDRRFTTEDTLYVRVRAPGLDATAIDENSFELEARGPGDEIEGHFTNHLDGVYTAAVAVAALQGSTNAWQVRAELDDETGNEVDARAQFVVRGLVDQPEWTTVRGTVRAATATSVTIGERTYGVGADTEVRGTFEDDEFESLVGQRVTLRATADEDGELVAHLVVVQGEDDERHSSLRLRGRIGLTADGSVRVQDTVFEFTRSTVIVADEDEDLGLGDLQPGLLVMVHAELAGDVWVASRIVVLTEDDEGGDEDEEEFDDESIEGVVDSVGVGYIVVAGQRLEVDSETKLEGFASLDELTVGAFVEAEFETRDDGLLWALDVEADERDDEKERDEDVDVKGVVTAVSADTIRAGGVAFLVTEETEVEGPDDTEITVADLYTGLEVEVEGRRTEDGAVVAIEIEIETEMETELEVKGVISAVTDSTIQVNDLSFVVTSQTNIEGEGGIVTFADLQVGTLIDVRLRGRSDGSFVALELEVEERFEAGDVEVTGSIEAVSSTEIEVGGLAFAVRGETEIEGRGDDANTTADLSIGQIVEVEGRRVADSSLVADKIEVKERLHREGALRGPIMAVKNDTLVVADVAFRAEPRTHIRGPQRWSDLAVGTLVEVDFRLFSDGTHLALRLSLEDEDEGARVKGIVDSVGTDFVVVAGVEVRTTSETTVGGPDGETLALADLTAGSTVVVASNWNGTALVAEDIQVRRAARMAGTVEMRQDDVMRVAGRDVALTARTRVYGRHNTVLELDDVHNGAFVEVLAVDEVGTSGKSSRTSTLTAESVQVLASTTSTSTGERPVLAEHFTLSDNYPNPFRTSTAIEFDLPHASGVTLTVYDVLGRQVATLVDGEREAGFHRVQWDGRNSRGQQASSGLYFYQFEAEGRTQTRRMLLVQ